MEDVKKIYLHLAIARSGFASRRAAEKLVRDGKVKVNGQTVTIPEHKINTAEDKIIVDGKPVKPEEKKVYFLLNKPAGILSASIDARRQTTVADLLPASVKKRVYPAGRLDKDTTGLLLLTNDGELTFRLTHPNFKVFKTYSAECRGLLKKDEACLLEKGIELEGKKTLPAVIKNIKFDKKQNKSSFTIEIFEGRKRQIKKMLLRTGHTVTSLKRIKYAGLTLGDLKEGQSRPLTTAEINHLKEKANLT